MAGKTKPQTKMGRPPIAPENKRSVQVKVSVTEAERDELQSAADAAQRTLADWCRVVLVGAARSRSP